MRICLSIALGFCSLATALLCAGAASAQTNVVGWGDNRYGQCNVPSGTYTAIATGDDFGMGIRTDGTLAAWGWNGVGECNVPSGTFKAIAGGGVSGSMYRCLVAHVDLA